MMHRIDVSKFDLNLLVALDALLAEAHVTRAAKRLSLSQSATSHALARLREILGDPLLVRGPEGMARTRRADALREPVRGLLEQMGRVLSADAMFEARTSERVFTLACPDLLAPAVPALLAAMTAEAPLARLDVAQPDPELADVALAPAPKEGPGRRMRPLGSLRFIVLARRGHPARRRFDAHAWVRYPHVQVRLGTPGPSLVDRALAAAGLERTIGVVVPGFLDAPEIVAQTDCFFTAPRELVGQIAERLELVMLEPPVALPPVPVAMVWNDRAHTDPAHQWFRGVVARVMLSTLRDGAPTRPRKGTKS
ncbi:MAG: LysR family transcriptional regulator [Polyangiaceae bacterium]|nr:LysR family transcriptional regulator [Polyangiaceae bacterium]